MLKEKSIKYNIRQKKQNEVNRHVFCCCYYDHYKTKTEICKKKQIDILNDLKSSLFIL